MKMGNGGNIVILLTTRRPMSIKRNVANEQVFVVQCSAFLRLAVVVVVVPLVQGLFALVWSWRFRLIKWQGGCIFNLQNVYKRLEYGISWRIIYIPVESGIMLLMHMFLVRNWLVKYSEFTVNWPNGPVCSKSGVNPQVAYICLEYGRGWMDWFA